MSTPACFVCGRWNDPLGGPDAHSGGCPNTGKPYGRCQHEDWDRTNPGWVPCTNPATTVRLADKPIATCAECADYYDPMNEQETEA